MPPGPKSLMSEASHITRRINQAEADAICARHDRLWTSKPGGARAVFAWTDLSGLDLTGRNLCDADFSGAVLFEADLREGVLAAADPKVGFRRIEAGGSAKIGDAQGAKLVGANL